MKKVLIGLLVFSTMSIAKADNDCFWKRAVSGFQTISNHTIIVDAGRDYKLTMARSCFGLRFANHIEFRTWPRSSSRVCKGDDIVIRNGFGNYPGQRCRILSIERQ